MRRERSSVRSVYLNFYNSMCRCCYSERKFSLTGRKITEEEFLKLVGEKFPNIEILSPYVAQRVKILRKCNICGDVREVQPRSLIEGHGCVVCTARQRAKEKTKSHTQFVAEMQKVNPNIEFLSQYKNAGSKIRCKCLIDGFEWDGVSHTLLEGHGCPECYRKKANRRNEAEFLAELKERFPTVKLKSKYTRVGVKVDYECSVCGYEWSAIPDTILNNPKSVGCPRCAGRGRVSETEYAKRVKASNEYVEYIGGFCGMEKHANFRCVKCGYEWHTLAAAILQGKACPHCRLSRGAIEVEKYLNEHGIEYEREYRFAECKNERQLPFDFFVPSLNMCIEYDGEQHFMPVRFGKDETDERVKSKFVSQKENDNIKTEYCRNNNINLIRIPYTEFNNINEILDKHIS